MDLTVEPCCTGRLSPAACCSRPGAARARLARDVSPGWIEGKMTGAMAVVETLMQEGCECVYGIPGAQENELWDTMKTKGLPYLLCTHEFSASTMADGYARATGKPGVLSVVPGPGVTNSLTGMGEALLDSVPLVAIVGDIAHGEKFRPFQVHCLDQVALLKPVTKGVFHVEHVSQIAAAVRQAFALAMAGEPGPVAVVVPYTLLIESARLQHAAGRGRRTCRSTRSASSRRCSCSRRPEAGRSASTPARAAWTTRRS